MNTTKPPVPAQKSSVVEALTENTKTAFDFFTLHARKLEISVMAQARLLAAIEIKITATLSRPHTAADSELLLNEVAVLCRELLPRPNGQPRQGGQS